MDTINGKSRAVMEFCLEWTGDGFHHRELLWADSVNMWRDCFPGGLSAALLEKGVGDTVMIDLGDGAAFFQGQRREMARIRPHQFSPPSAGYREICPQPGRFYPQGYLHGVNGVFSESLDPARCIGMEKGDLLFDLNHPLRGKKLGFGAEVIKIHEEKTERGGRCEDWLEKAVSDGPGMQSRVNGQETDFFSSPAMERADESPDAVFYQTSRMVQHLDSAALATIGNQYAQLIEPGARVLDLMGSWDSHLPSHLALGQLTVLGMNPQELEANDRATAKVVQDLNHAPRLGFAEGAFDAVICTASIEYLTDPLSVFAEVHRILRPGGLLAIAFSNRWFPPKAVKVWTELHDFERLGMVMEMFLRTSGWQELATLTRRGLPRPDDDPHWQLPYSDPVFMAWGRKG